MQNVLSFFAAVATIYGVTLLDVNSLLLAYFLFSLSNKISKKWK